MQSLSSDFSVFPFPFSQNIFILFITLQTSKVPLKLQQLIKTGNSNEYLQICPYKILHDEIKFELQFFYLNLCSNNAKVMIA